MYSFRLLIIVLLMLSSIPVFGVFTLTIDKDSVSMGTGLHPDDAPFTKEPAITTTVVNGGDVVTWYLKAHGSGGITSSVKSSVIPLDRLSIKGGDLDVYTALVATPPVQIETGGVGTFNIIMDYKLDINWTDVAAPDYAVTVWYTLTGE